MRTPIIRSLIGASTALLAGCAVGPDFTAPVPQVPSAWTAAAEAAPAHVEGWWTTFNDAELTSLITRAAAENLDAQAAVLRIAEARAQRDVVAADGRPSLSANASGQINRLSESTPTGALFNNVGKFPGLSGIRIPNPYQQDQVGFDASWEIDLFGRVRRSVEAADADTQASVEDSRSVVITTLGEVARAYMDLRGAQARRRLASQTIDTDRELLDLADESRQAGTASQIDVARAAAEASGAQAQLPVLDQQITVDINQLSKLLALEPGALKAELQSPQPVPPVPSLAPVGLPADLARRRPDIREAEARLHAATARVGVAVGDLYPKLTLGAQGGYQAQSLPLLTQWASRFLTAGPSVELPIFEGGRLRATVRLQDAQAKAAALEYRNTVLAALHEVDDALSAYGADQAREMALADTVAQDAEAAELAQQRYANGLAAYIDVLVAQRTLQQNELLSADARTAVSIDLVVIYKALGGGWGAT